MKFLLVALFFFTLGAGGQPAFAQKEKSCAMAVTLYGRLKPGFLDNRKAPYTKEVLNQTPVKNQCSLGTCHLYAVTSQLEMNFRKNHGRQILLSPDYLAYQHIVARLKTLLEDTQSYAKKFALGGDFEIDWSLIQQAGLMPDGIYKFNPVYSSKDFAPRMEQFILNLRNRMIYERNEIDRKDNSRTERGAARAFQRKEAVVARTETAILDFIDQFMGTPPSAFEYEGQTYTPASFAKKFFPDLQGSYYNFSISDFNRADYPLKVHEYGQNIFSKITPQESLVKIKDAIDEDKNVYLGYYHVRAFTDPKTGIQSLSAFEIPPGGEPLPRAFREENDLHLGDSHAVQIVGYELNSAGEIIRLKIKNSWGEKSGDRGYYHMSVDYYLAFSNRLGIF